MEKVENLAEDIACNCKKSKCLKLYVLASVMPKNHGLDY